LVCDLRGALEAPSKEIFSNSFMKLMGKTIILDVDISKKSGRDMP
jgi:hypothetical protein